MDYFDRVHRRELLRWTVAAGLTLPLSGSLAKLVTAAPAVAKKNVADVLRFSTRPQGWKGLFGFVTFRLHPVFVDGNRAYHIRTDASDAAFARRVGLVHVPKLQAAIKTQAAADYFTFTNGASGQLPVVTAAPTGPDFTPAFRLSRVAFTRSPRRLTSIEQVRDAAADGRVKIAASQTVVNYPFVKWPGGELPVDRERVAYLGGGQLLRPPDVQNREVTFKLQQCFPGEWYIVTDTSASPMAPMMRIAASPKSGELTKAGATAKILVFGNGVKGPGPMGFQPSVVDSLPGNPVWSPFWDHFTFTWTDGTKPLVVRSQAELLRQEENGRLTRWPGTPDTQGVSFVVNCPVPISAPVTWK